MKIWTPKKKPPCLKNGYAQTFKDMLAYKNRFRFNPLAKVGSLFVPKPLRMSPGYPCCCGGGVCDLCVAGTIPSQMQVTFSGLENQVCEECTTFNTEIFVLDYISPCLWGMTDLGVCSAISLQVLLADNGAPWNLRIWIGLKIAPGSDWGWHIPNLSEPLDCSAFNNDVATRYSASGNECYKDTAPAPLAYLTSL